MKPMQTLGAMLLALVITGCPELLLQLQPIDGGDPLALTLLMPESGTRPCTDSGSVTVALDWDAPGASVLTTYLVSFETPDGQHVTQGALQGGIVQGEDGIWRTAFTANAFSFFDGNMFRVRVQAYNGVSDEVVFSIEAP